MNIHDPRLSDANGRFLVATERSRSDIIVGAPHHAPLGQATLPCPEHRDADENTGYLAVAVASHLDCHSIVAVNPEVDGNKDMSTDYARAIAAWAPALLLEIHGHGGVRAHFDIEVSAGSRDRSWISEWFAHQLEEAMAEHEPLWRFTVSGVFSSLYFRASRTATIAGASWTGVHIDLPPQLRKHTPDEPVPSAGYLLARLIARSAESTLSMLSGSGRTV